MIVDDMMSFIKSDLIFGLGVLFFTLATLWFIFKII